MARTSRTTLKAYFRKGLIPKESDFADLIDSMLVQNDDSLFIPTNGPLSINAIGSDETLLNFYASGQPSTPTWQLKQNPGAIKQPGLSIHEGTGNPSRLFIEKGSGNIGIGTTEPKSPLSVSGGVAVGATYAKNAAPTNGLIVEGSVGIGTTTPTAKLHIQGRMSVETSALSFNGTTTFVSLLTMDAKIDYSNGFTVEAWVYYRSFNSWSRIIDLSDESSGNNIIFANSGKTNDLAFQIYSGATGGKIVLATGVLDLNTWMHLAATINKEGKVVLYKNGQQIKTDNNSTSIIGKVSRNKNNIGKSNWSGDGFFDGRISDLRIWNNVRTQQQIQDQIYATLSGREAGLVGYWPLNATNQARDLGPNALHGTIKPEGNAQIMEVQGVGFTYNTITATGSSADQNLILAPKGNGNVGIGAPSQNQGKLTIQASSNMLQLRRENSETTGGKLLFLELYQHDSHPDAAVPVVYPNIRFHHHNRFWHRIEGRDTGLHIKTGDLDKDAYASIFAQIVNQGSSREFKENIAELDSQAALDALEQLNPMTFTYKNDADSGQNVGFIAEDVPDLVARPGRKHLSAMDIVAVLTKVVQEQQKTIVALVAQAKAAEQ